MSVSSEIVVEKVSGVTLIPVRASFDRGGRMIAWVLEGRRFVPREITVGRKSETQIEVTKGLAPGDVVALEEPAGAAPAPGNGKPGGLPGSGSIGRAGS